MFRRVLLGCVLCIGCKSTVRVTETTPPTAPASAVSARPETSAPAASSPTLSPARLAPTSKQPFPDGPDDATLCAAIHSKEPDPWLRFGHFIPMFWDGVIWVGEGDERTLEATIRAIATYAPGFLGAEGRACSEGGVLLYVADLYDGYEDSLRNKHTMAELEAAAFKAEAVAKQAMQERVAIQGRAGMLALQDLCRQDAVVCDEQLRLRYEHGICGDVIALARSQFRSADRPWATTELGRSLEPNLDEPRQRREFLQTCQSLPAQVKVCVIVDDNVKVRGRDRCWASLATLFGY